MIIFTDREPAEFVLGGLDCDSSGRFVYVGDVYSIGH
jgi:hypothetical protein